MPTNVQQQTCINAAGNILRSCTTVSANVSDSVNTTLAANAANVLVNATFLIANLKSWFAQANQSVTVKTNSNSAPQDTINLTTNSPSQWYCGALMANPLSNNITAIWLTNNTGTPAQVNIEILRSS